VIGSDGAHETLLCVVGVVRTGSTGVVPVAEGITLLIRDWTAERGPVGRP